MGWETFRLETMLPIGQVRPGTDSMLESNTVEPDLIATEMLALPSKSSRNKNNSDLMNGKTTLM